ncbi:MULTISPECIES: hypothetical protein [unclassified Pseudonocardia]|uniref:hypothetical protein n=1 Tax=unclassified Pseudonocardia TaxID=2619320 RepID=UPI0009628867|nr:MULTISPECIES: hypothetical protein [unclassified Pseudonocardia]OLM29653.1 hypothetical protein Ae717Ps2_0546 [Pseudonocardia sp. Ae717_Ps2]
MTRVDLNQRERAVLLTLLAEGRELTNAQLQEAGGVRLDGEPRRRLNEHGLVDSRKVGRGFVHEISDAGTAWCTQELGATRPDRAGYLGGALYAILHGIERTGIPLSELFPYRPDPQARIRDAVARLTEPGGWVGLSRLRKELADLSRGDVDAALTDLAVSPGVHLQSEPNTKALTAADHEAAVTVAGEPRHMIMIENG